MDWPLKLRHVARETLAQTPVQFRIAGLPQLVADVDAIEINVPITEAERCVSSPGRRIADFINPPALLRRFGLARIKHHAIAQLERGFKIQDDAIAEHTGNVAKINAPLLAEAGVDELLIVGPAEPARGKSAGKSHLQFITRSAECGVRKRRRTRGSAFRTPRSALIQGLPIDARDVGNVFRRLEAALNF